MWKHNEEREFENSTQEGKGKKNSSQTLGTCGISSWRYPIDRWTQSLKSMIQTEDADFKVIVRWIITVALEKDGIIPWTED